MEAYIKQVHLPVLGITGPYKHPRALLPHTFAFTSTSLSPGPFQTSIAIGMWIGQCGLNCLVVALSFDKRAV